MTAFIALGVFNAVMLCLLAFLLRHEATRLRQANRASVVGDLEPPAWVNDGELR